MQRDMRAQMADVFPVRCGAMFLTFVVLCAGLRQASVGICHAVVSLGACYRCCGMCGCGSSA